MKRICIMMLVLVVLALLAGCISKEVNLSMSDNSTQVKLNKGQILVVALEANPSTGYTWEVAELDNNTLRQMGEPAFKPESSAIGAKGTMTMQFEALNTGQTALKLIYHRPWEKDVPPINTFSVQVVVS